MPLTTASEYKRFAVSAALHCPEAKGCVWFDHMRYRTMYAIEFESGAMFQGTDKVKVMDEAKQHSAITRRLTGAV